jgi:hypothetical protein
MRNGAVSDMARTASRNSMSFELQHPMQGQPRLQRLFALGRFRDILPPEIEPEETWPPERRSECTGTRPSSAVATPQRLGPRLPRESGPSRPSASSGSSSNAWIARPGPLREATPVGSCSTRSRTASKKSVRSEMQCKGIRPCLSLAGTSSGRCPTREDFDHPTSASSSPPSRVAACRGNCCPCDGEIALEATAAGRPVDDRPDRCQMEFVTNRVVQRRVAVISVRIGTRRRRRRNSVGHGISMSTPTSIDAGFDFGPGLYLVQYKYLIDCTSHKGVETQQQQQQQQQQHDGRRGTIERRRRKRPSLSGRRQEGGSVVFTKVNHRRSPSPRRLRGRRRIVPRIVPPSLCVGPCPVPARPSALLVRCLSGGPLCSRSLCLVLAGAVVALGFASTEKGRSRLFSRRCRNSLIPHLFRFPPSA